MEDKRFPRRELFRRAKLLGIAALLTRLPSSNEIIDPFDRLRGQVGDIRYLLDTVANSSFTKANQLTIAFRPGIKDTSQINISTTVRLYKVFNNFEDFEKAGGQISWANGYTPDAITHNLKLRLLVSEKTEVVQRIRNFRGVLRFEKADGVDSTCRYEYEVSSPDIDNGKVLLTGFTHSPKYLREEIGENIPRPFIRLAYGSCQKYGNGLFGMLSYLSRHNPDLFVHLGDWFYELEPQYRMKMRNDLSGEGNDFQSYLDKIQQYNFDEAIQELERSVPMVVMMDDHNAENNFAGRGELITKKLLDGFKAHVAAFASPENAEMHGLHRRIDHSNGARSIFLDTRRFRDPDLQTMLGKDQLKWFIGELLHAKKDGVKRLLIHSSVPFAMTQDSDSWAGYPYEAQKIVDVLVKYEITNVTFVTGGPHAFYFGDVHEDLNDPKSRVIATEICVGAITSTPSTLKDKLKKAVRAVTKNINGGLEIDVNNYDGSIIARVFRNDPKDPDTEYETVLEFAIPFQNSWDDPRIELITNNLDSDDLITDLEVVDMTVPKIGSVKNVGLPPEVLEIKLK